MRQTTIMQRIECAGIGLHSGKRVKMTLRPAVENTGILFHTVNAQNRHAIIPVPEAVVATGLATTLGTNEVKIATVEHLLAALRGLSIDNIHIDVEGGEIPIMDGSAAPFVMLLDEAGIRTQTAPRRVYRIKTPVNFVHAEKSIKAEPYEGFLVEYTIAFPHPAIGTQRMSLEVTPQTFASIAKSRTFGFLREVELLKEQGLALGGSLDNAVVLDEQGVVNCGGLRHPDEFVRHKLLDFIGDMAVLPLPLQGRFTVVCSGHALNNNFLRHLVSAKSYYLDCVTLSDKENGAVFPRRLPHAVGEELPAPVYAG